MTGGITREVVTSYDANTGGASSTIATLLTGNSTGNTTGKDIEIYYTGKAKLSASGTTGVVTSGSLVYKAYSFNSSGNSLVYHYEFTFPKAPANLAKSSYFNFVYKENAKAVGSTSQPVYVNSSGQILACTDISTVGLTHIGTAQPTNSNYVLWVDTDEDTSNMMRADAIKYKTFSIATSAWSGSGPYTYTMTAAGITENSAILNLTLDAASQTYQKAQLDWETGANKITLSTATKPTGTISGYLIATEVTVI